MIKQQGFEENIYTGFKIIFRSIGDDFFHCCIYSINAVSMEIYR